MPVRFFRKFWQRIRLTGDMSELWPYLGSLATFFRNPSQERKLKAQLKRGANKKVEELKENQEVLLEMNRVKAARFQKFDKNGDNKISYDTEQGDPKDENAFIP